LRNIKEFMESAARANPEKHAEIMAHCAAPQIDPADFCNEFALSIANGFNNGQLTYEFCDDAMNYLFGFMTHPPVFGADKDMPEPAFTIYEAFDAGEFTRPGDAPDVDPVEKYTKPLIKEVLAQYAAARRAG